MSDKPQLDPVNSGDAAGHRRTFQFRISALLVFTFLVALFFAGWVAFTFEGVSGFTTLVAVCLLTPFALFLIVLIQGRLRGIPIAILGFSVGAAVIWCVSEDSLQDIGSQAAGLGCLLGAIASSIFQLSQRNVVSRFGRPVLMICLAAAVFVGGTWAHLIARVVWDRIA